MTWQINQLFLFSNIRVTLGSHLIWKPQHILLMSVASGAEEETCDSPKDKRHVDWSSHANLEYGFCPLRPDEKWPQLHFVWGQTLIIHGLWSSCVNGSGLTVFLPDFFMSLFHLCPPEKTKHSRVSYTAFISLAFALPHVTTNGFELVYVCVCVFLLRVSCVSCASW